MDAHALRHSLFVALAASATTLAACGGGTPAARAPESATEAVVEPTSVEEAQVQIARARALLDRQAADPPVDTEVTPPLKTPRAPGPAPDRQPAGAAKASTNGSEEARCSSPCRALASMRRAVIALCRMTSEADARCVDAKRTLTESEGRITPCTC